MWALEQTWGLFVCVWEEKHGTIQLDGTKLHRTGRDVKEFAKIQAPTLP